MKLYFSNLLAHQRHIIIISRTMKSLRKKLYLFLKMNYMDLEEISSFRRTAEGTVVEKEGGCSRTCLFYFRIKFRSFKFILAKLRFFFFLYVSDFIFKILRKNVNANKPSGANTLLCNSFSRDEAVISFETFGPVLVTCGSRLATKWESTQRQDS